MGMRLKNPCFGVFLLCFLLLSAVVSTAQSSQSEYVRRIQNGLQLYDLSRWYEAAIEFRRAQDNAVNSNDWSQALYWVILSELAYSDYGSALKDMDELQIKAPYSSFNRDMNYHRARVYFNQGFFDEALLLFRQYADSTAEIDRESSDRKAAAFFWMGECLYSMGQFDEAENFYAWVVVMYPESLKKDAASYRIDLIKQKKIETELLALLQWSHEESLRTSEDYQRRLRTYEYALNTYQRRIAELTGQPDSGILPLTQSTVPAQTSTPTQSSVPSQTSAPTQSAVQSEESNQSQNSQKQQAPNEELLEWARRLGIDVQQLMGEVRDSWGGM